MMNTETKNLNKIEIFNTSSINQKSQYSQKQNNEITQKGKAKKKRNRLHGHGMEEYS